MSLKIFSRNSRCSSSFWDHWQEAPTAAVAWYEWFNASKGIKVHFLFSSSRSRQKNSRGDEWDAINKDLSDHLLFMCVKRERGISKENVKMQ